MADEISAIRTMLAKDVISAKLASAYVTVDGNRYLLFQAKSLEATIEKEKEEVAILGRLMKGKGVDTYFDLQVVNNDPTSEAGKHTVILTGCNIDKGTVAGFDAEGKWLEDEISFTFEGIKVPEKFKELDGMKA